MAVQIVALPNAYTMDWRQWSDFVTGYNPGLREHVDPDEDWQHYAVRLREVVPEAPTPDGFVAWQDWATALKLVLQL